ncbi:MAG: CoA pyrophosphatase [Anaerolineales bacterium]
MNRKRGLNYAPSIPPPNRKAFARQVPPILQEANLAFDKGEFGRAAELFERIAEGFDARNGRALRSFICKRDARVFSPVKPRWASLRQAPGLAFAERQNYQRLLNAKTRIVDELNSRGLTNEAKDIEAWLKALLSAPELDTLTLKRRNPSCRLTVRNAARRFDLMKSNGWTKSRQSVVIAEALCEKVIRRTNWQFVLQPTCGSHTEQFISQRLQNPLLCGTLHSDSYAEIDVLNDSQLKCAAVLIPLVRQNNEWHIIFAPHGQSQIAQRTSLFPGQRVRRRRNDSEQTALREVEEEIGIRTRDVNILGRMANLITISFFRVTPVVGVVKWPNVFRVGEDEVARVFTIPLEWLAKASTRWQFERPNTTRTLIAYHPYDGELLWGATARMTVDFLNVLGL